MPDGAWSDYQIEQWLDGIEAETLWMALFFDDPYAVADPLTVELTGGGYARQQMTLARPSARLLRVSNPLTWTGLSPGAQVLATGAFDAAANGNLRVRVLEETPLVIGQAGTLTIAANEYYLGVDV